MQDRKKDLEEVYDVVCQTWEQCQIEHGIDHEICIAWQIVKDDAEQELKAICEIID